MTAFGYPRRAGDMGAPRFFRRRPEMGLIVCAALVQDSAAIHFVSAGAI